MRKIKLPALLLSVVFLISCLDGEINKPNGNKEVGYATISFTDMASPYAPRGEDPAGELSTGMENDVNTLGLFIFNADGLPDGISGGYIELVGNQDTYNSSTEHQIPVEAGQKIFLAVANIAEADLAAATTLNAARSVVNRYELNNTNSRKLPALDASTGNIPMSGEVTEEVKVTVPARVTIGLSRAISRLDKLVAPAVTVEIPEAELKELFEKAVLDPGYTVSFNLNKYYIINGMKKSYTFFNYNSSNDEDSAWDKWMLGITSPDYDNYYQSTYANNQPVTVYSGTNDAGNDVWISATDTKIVYIHENSPVEVTSPVDGYHKRSVTSIILEGKLTYNGDDAGAKVRYWRLNIASEFKYKLFRNVVYTVTLENIKSKGFDTPEEAEEGEEEVIAKNPTVIATVTINNWRKININEDV